ncbi:MAG: UPF0280 family protein [Candidatus Omnitrophota bacterium]
MNDERFYRRWVRSEDLITFEVAVGETDLMIACDKPLDGVARDSAVRHRREIEQHIERNEAFRTSLAPLPIIEGDNIPPVVSAMISASKSAGVGPMAAVAGAMAEFVGRDLLVSCREIIVENGGDIFLRTRKTRTFGLFAGNSPFSGTVALEVDPDEDGLGVCTSSGTVGHSLSFGKADAVVVIAHDAALADAVATAAGNMVRTETDAESAVRFARTVVGVRAALCFSGKTMASWGSGFKIV